MTDNKPISPYFFKVRVDTFNDEKIKIIDDMPDNDAIIVIWFKLIALAMKINDGGWIYLLENKPYSDERLASAISRPVNTVRLAINTFLDLEMIEIQDQGIFLLNFEKHQSVEKLSLIKEQTRLRVAKHRENKLLQARNVTVTKSNATETETETETEKEKEKEQQQESSCFPINSLEIIFNELLRCFQENFLKGEKKEISEKNMISLNSYAEELKDKKFHPELIQEAFEESVTAGKTFIGYTKGVLNNWIEQGRRHNGYTEEKDWDAGELGPMVKR